MPGLRRALALVALGLLATGSAEAQGAIDPNVAPRAAALEREGERHMAIDLLGRYLATAPDDGRAWLQLGRFYLYDARDWHAHGHRSQPDGLLYLDFAATALEQSMRLSVDSGLIFRGIVEVERGLVAIETVGWAEARTAIRRDHECAHYFTRRLFGSMRNHAQDELMADWAGLVAATGRFRAEWFLRFLGLEEYPLYRSGGRLDLYRGDPDAQGGLDQ
jgi:hypothetical protein